MNESVERVERALAAVRAGELVILVDDETREDEGDFVIAAEHADPATVNTMISVGRGLLCAAVAPEVLDPLGLPMMVRDNDSPHETAFTVSIDIANGGTGISVKDRSETIKALAEPSSVTADFVRPGHVFPLRAVAGGVLERRGHTEAAVDLMRLAGLRPAAAICEILDEVGEPARRPFLGELARKMDLPILEIADVADYVADRHLVHRAAETTLPTTHGRFRMLGYRDSGGTEHLALVMGDPATAEAPLVRLHSECLTGDIFASGRCDCGAQLDAAMATVAEAACGVIVYLRGHEGRGIGLLDKLRAYALQDGGLGTVEANLAQGLPVNARNYRVGAAILRDLGVSSARLLTNNVAKVHGLGEAGIAPVSRVPLETGVTAENLAYLEAKRMRLGHLLTDPSQRTA